MEIEYTRTLKNVFRIISLLLFLLSHQALSFDLINVFSEKVRLVSSGYFTTEDQLSPERALTQAFQPLPQKAMSIGLDKSSRWFYFEIYNESISETRYLEYQNKIASVVKLYVFKEGKLIREEVKGYKVGRFDVEPIRFALEQTTEPIVYLMSVESILSDFIVFNIGDTESLHRAIAYMNTFTIITVSALSVLIIYNMFLFFATREGAYFYYVLYVSALLLIDLNIRGLIPIYNQNGEAIDIYFTTLLLIQIDQIGLTFFTIKVLDLDKKDPVLKKYIMIAFYMDILLTPTMLFGLELVMLISIHIMGAVLIYAGIRSMLSKNKVALYYLLATGIAVILLSIWVISMLNVIIPITIWSNSLCHIALIWDGLMLSFVLAYRIRLLQEENHYKEKMILMQSRQNQIGELSGNIAHQWRQPLTEIGAIMTNLEAKLIYGSAPNKTEILAKVSHSMTILRHLSDTVTTFQSFFQKHHNATEFKVIDTVSKTLNFIDESMKNNQITIQYHHPDHEITLIGDANALSQALLSILLNAKDALLDRQIINPTIHVEITHQNGRLLIHICDNAGGINIRPIESIFDSYVTDKAQGTGIGLFITRSIIEKSFNGQVSAKNSKQGACFEISIAY